MEKYTTASKVSAADVFVPVGVGGMTAAITTGVAQASNGANLHIRRWADEHYATIQRATTS